MNMLKALYGSFKIKDKKDWLILPVRIVYLIYTLPFLLVVLILYARGIGAFKDPYKGKTNKRKMIGLHFSFIIMSFFIWRCFYLVYRYHLK